MAIPLRGHCRRLDRLFSVRHEPSPSNPHAAELRDFTPGSLGGRGVGLLVYGVVSIAQPIPTFISEATSFPGRPEYQGTAALIQDLKDRDMLKDTLVVWGGEFGRTVYSQGRLTEDDYGRDHHPRCFTIFMAGGGVEPGMSYGETDDFSYNITKDPVHVHDLHATILHLLGIDHMKLTFKYQGRHFRLTDVHGKVVEKVLA